VRAMVWHLPRCRHARPLWAPHASASTCSDGHAIQRWHIAQNFLNSGTTHHQMPPLTALLKHRTYASERLWNLCSAAFCIAPWGTCAMPACPCTSSPCNTPGAAATYKQSALGNHRCLPLQSIASTLEGTSTRQLSAKYRFEQARRPFDSAAMLPNKRLSSAGLYTRAGGPAAPSRSAAVACGSSCRRPERILMAGLGLTAEAGG
jgi:hypothetical protein